MGYHITLLCSPPRMITWPELSDAARRLGWQADDATREVRLGSGDHLVARVMHGDDGEPWCKLMNEEELGHVITLAGALSARARGDEFESYRSVEDWYVHPADKAEREAADAARAALPSRSARQWRARLMTVAVFVVIGLAFQMLKG